MFNDIRDSYLSCLCGVDSAPAEYALHVGCAIVGPSPRGVMSYAGLGKLPTIVDLGLYCA